ncbi:hypothetical protein ParKJ_09690 [Paraburkholderia fungorum]|uniref:Uncharacterized protein n=1 Tax=Paraburkholderia fungorum TaxID=134537 RepID=A0AAP5Q6R8_9BURK|nr:hypothetical protein [Paraburkholderia fungorum]MDT8837684.1 hypothetical protein [Paraburkholderia fungorum]
MKTSEANLEFSYDSRNRAEVARERRNIVDICATVLPGEGHERRLFQQWKQSAAPQLALSFLFEQMQRSARHREIRRNRMPRRYGKEKPPEGGSYAK